MEEPKSVKRVRKHSMKKSTKKRDTTISIKRTTTEVREPLSSPALINRQMLGAQLWYMYTTIEAQETAKLRETLAEYQTMIQRRFLAEDTLLQNLNLDNLTLAIADSWLLFKFGMPDRAYDTFLATLTTPPIKIEPDVVTVVEALRQSSDETSNQSQETPCNTSISTSQEEVHSQQ